MEPYIQLMLLAADAVLTLFIGWGGWRLNKYRKLEEERVKKELARDKLQLAVARTILIRECTRYISKGYAPLYAVASINEMYQSYQELGGNVAVTSAYSEFIVLPHTQKEE